METAAAVGFSTGHRYAPAVDNESDRTWKRASKHTMWTPTVRTPLYTADYSMRYDALDPHRLPHHCLLQGPPLSVDRHRDRLQGTPRRHPHGIRVGRPADRIAYGVTALTAARPRASLTVPRTIATCTTTTTDPEGSQAW
jgi:hypothetical protein